LRRPPTPSEKSEEDQQHHPQSGKSKSKKGRSIHYWQSEFTNTLHKHTV
jgi:hypothetical protein